MAKVLKLGDFGSANEKCEELSKLAQVIECESKDREEFIKDLHDKYNDITHIARTYESVTQTGLFDQEIVKHLPQALKSISHNGAGFDQIKDIKGLTDRKIQVSNVTEPVEAPTACTAVYLVLSCLRNYQHGHSNIKNWERDGKAAGVEFGNSPEGKTVGILGMGGIGRAIRDRLKPFGFNIVYHNRSQLKPELENGAKYVSKEELYQSDVICISVPLNEKTRHSINKEEILKMKDGIIIVNTSRGAVIDEKILPELIKSGKIKSFGADVFENEPKISPELLELPQVVSLPHMGTHTYEAVKEMQEWTIDNVISCLKTGKVKSLIPEQGNVQF
ncbi:unnamed protein product [Candida verbasci]|uniref:Glyoxylate reductase n=1 Tax=Candida verbasci TaxID=1227364 RepID=A0A9W4TW74_9ASCO|nr:unnamed protein product [Candida verbasci]